MTMTRLMVWLLLAASASLAGTAAADDAGDAGSRLFHRCAACHLPTGKGVPGSFPPLGAQVAQAAQSAPGRAYLVLVVSKGLMGPISVSGQSYRGVMPAQSGLSDQDAADVLNHVLHDLANAADATPFTAAEVARIRQANAQATARTVHDMRADLFVPQDDGRTRR